MITHVARGVKGPQTPHQTKWNERRKVCGREFVLSGCLVHGAGGPPQPLFCFAWNTFQAYKSFPRKKEKKTFVYCFIALLALWKVSVFSTLLRYFSSSFPNSWRSSNLPLAPPEKPPISCVTTLEMEPLITLFEQLLILIANFVEFPRWKRVHSTWEKCDSFFLAINKSYGAITLRTLQLHDFKHPTVTLF